MGNDTDRICFFLSVNLLDFASDLLMLVMTAVILLRSIRRWPWSRSARCRSSSGWCTSVREPPAARLPARQRAWAEMTSVLADTIPGIRVVKAFAQEQREIERFRQANDRVLRPTTA